MYTFYLLRRLYFGLPLGVLRHCTFSDRSLVHSSLSFRSTVDYKSRTSLTLGIVKRMVLSKSRTLGCELNIILNKHLLRLTLRPYFRTCVILGNLIYPQL